MFRVDEKGPFPDPRSPFQPNGVFGPSSNFDHSQFAWTDRGWNAPPLSDAIIYELHVGTFTPTGTFEGVISRLEHLKEIGITHIELMPVAEFQGDFGWGYDGVFPFAPHHHYGGPNGLKKLVNACHEAGLAVLLDVVFNHFGPSGNCVGCFGPFYTNRYQTPWGDGMNFDGAHSDEVRRYFLDAAAMWLRDYHFDGLRLDAIHAIVDTSAIHFLEALAKETHDRGEQLGRRLVLIAESDLNDPRVVRSTDSCGYNCDAQWSDDFHHALHTVLTGEDAGYYSDFGTIKDLADAIERPFIYDGRYSRFRSRSHGRPADDLPADRFIVSLQNHDQIGNRAIGERIGHLIHLERLKIGAALTLLSPYVPLIFQGEEWNATAPFLYFADWCSAPELAQSVATGRRKEFPQFSASEIPDPCNRSTAERSRLDWSELETHPHVDVLNWYRDLIALRKRLGGCASAARRVAFDEDAGWLRFERGLLVIVCNFKNEPQSVELDLTDVAVALDSSGSAKLLEHRIQLAGNSVIALCRRPTCNERQFNSDNCQRRHIENTADRNAGRRFSD